MKTIVCIASGPSLTPDDVEYCRARARVYAVNDVYRLAPWADVLYAADGSWWDVHKGCPEFAGERWTCNDDAAAKYGLRHIPVKNIEWSHTPGALGGGGNSGFQTINKASLDLLAAGVDGTERIILLGYDYGHKSGTKKHFFGEHPPDIDKVSNFRGWVQRIHKAAGQMKIPVINCSRESAIKCFPRAHLRDVL